MNDAEEKVRFRREMPRRMSGECERKARNTQVITWGKDVEVKVKLQVKVTARIVRQLKPKCNFFQSLMG
jgi:hypothetical protein